MWRQCHGCTNCSARNGTLDQPVFMAAACTPFADTVCSNVTECGPEQYETASQTETSDRICADCTVCEEVRQLRHDFGPFMKWWSGIMPPHTRR